MADRTLERPEMDERDAGVPRIGRAQAPGQDQARPGRVLAQMAAAAGEGLGRAVAGVRGLALIAADHGVAQVVPVALGALDAFGRMNVPRGQDPRLLDRRDRVAGQAAPVLRRIGDIEEIAVLAVEIDGPVLDRRRDGPFVVVKVWPVVDVPGFLKARGHAADLADSARGRGRPAQVLAQDLLGPFAVVLAPRLVVAGEAVDLRLAGDVPARIRAREEDFLARLGRAAARHVAAEELGEIPRVEAQDFRVPGPRPLPVGQRQDGPRLRVEPDPGLARPPALLRFHGVPVPAALDGLVIMAGAAGEAGREGQGIDVGRHDERVRLVAERDEVGRARAVPVPGLGLLVGGPSASRVECEREGAEEEQAGRRPGGSSGGPHARNCSGRNSVMRRALTASLALSTATHDS